MSRSPLWTWADLRSAVDGDAPADGPAITGISIDTRTIEPGDLFVALKDVRDGHEFVADAFARGAAAALVSRDYAPAAATGPLVRVDEPLAALQRLGRAARARLREGARVVAVTGSAGKTGTKEMLRVSLSACGRVHASEKSYNNHWGVPLTLARMPADTDFGVFEIGMNHAGEITPLTRMVRPDIAIVTNVLPVHLGQFPNVEGIAEAKAEIFAGLGRGGIAIILRDSPHFELLRRRAGEAGARVATFGLDAESDVRLAECVQGRVRAILRGPGEQREAGFLLGVPGEHIAVNALAVAAALDVLGCLTEKALKPLAMLGPPVGRGQRTQLTVGGGTALLIDESYNANPASMKAALAVVGGIPGEMAMRRIAVIGDMRELGPEADRFHLDLAPEIEAARIDLVFAAGPHMRGLFDRLPAHVRGVWKEAAVDLREPLLAAVRAGDVIMVKGSLGTRMGPLVDALKSHFGPAT
jgi:UDP-N-acetylmuramoyl-tripeptide--D-alanyl-D-alanine ligase